MKKIAEEIIRKLGGAENIESMVHCTTRVKLKVKNDWAVDKNALEETDGILGLFESNGYLQLIVKNAPDVYAEIADAAGVCKDPENSKESPSANRDSARPEPVKKQFGFIDWLKAELADNNGSGYVKADVLDDGTLIVTVPGIDKIKRVIVADEKTSVRRVYHQDGKPEN